MKSQGGDYRLAFRRIFSNFENMVTIVLSVIVGLIVLFALAKIIQHFYTLTVGELFLSGHTTFDDYRELFGRILTLLIGLEFLSSILKALDVHEVRALVQDVTLITALAISRKLIIYDFDNHDPMATIVLGGLLVCLGVFFFLIKRGTAQRPRNGRAV